MSKKVAGIIALVVLCILAVVGFFSPEHFFATLHALTALIIAGCAMRGVVLIDEFGREKYREGQNKVWKDFDDQEQKWAQEAAEAWMEEQEEKEQQSHQKVSK